MRRSTSARGRHRPVSEDGSGAENQGNIPVSSSGRPSRAGPDPERQSPPSLPPVFSPSQPPQKTVPAPPRQPPSTQAMASPPHLTDLRPRQSQTPSTKCIRDMLGPTNMGELSVIFRELVRMLKDLPPGGFDKAYGHRHPTSVAAKPVSFMCDKQQFKDAVRLAEMGAELASKAHNPEEPPPDPFVETILAGMRSLEAKVDQLALDTANLASHPPTPPKSFAAAAAGGISSGPTGTKMKTGPKGKKPPSVQPPPPSPQAHLVPIIGGQVELCGAHHRRRASGLQSCRCALNCSQGASRA